MAIRRDGCKEWTVVVNPDGTETRVGGIRDICGKNNGMASLNDVPVITISGNRSPLSSQPYFRDADGPTTAVAMAKQRSFQVVRSGDALPPDPEGGTCSTCGQQSTTQMVVMSVVVIGVLIGAAALAIKLLR